MPAFIAGRRVAVRRESGGSQRTERARDLQGHEDLLAVFERDAAGRILVSITLLADTHAEFLERMDEVAARSRDVIVRQQLFGLGES